MKSHRYAMIQMRPRNRPTLNLLRIKSHCVFLYLVSEVVQVPLRESQSFFCGRLDLIVFTAPQEYYFAHYAPTVEQIFNSVQVAG